MELMYNLVKLLEKDKQVKIVYACETGSRAWGFPSPDSDYDVRFIYMHTTDWYLSLSDRKDSIEYMDGDLDVTGWDLRKALKLLKKSNVPLIERFNSPIEYYAVDGFKDEFKKLIGHYYSPVAVFYHHYSLAKNFWYDMKELKSYKLKSFFYLVRSLLSCNWIVNDNNVVPMHLEGLLMYVDEDRSTALRNLVKLKSAVGESYLHTGDDSWFEWIRELFDYLETAKEQLTANKVNMALLDDFFIKTIYGKANS